MEAVAAGDDVAFERLRRVPSCLKWIAGRVAVEAVDVRRLRLEQDRAAAAKPRRDQVLHHLLLAVDGDDLARRQHRQVDVDDAAAEADVEPRVGHALAMQPLAGAELVHQIDGALLQHAGAHAAFDVVAAPRLQHDAVDAGAMQQQRQEQPGRTGADDADLRAHPCSLLLRLEERGERADLRLLALVVGGEPRVEIGEGVEHLLRGDILADVVRNLLHLADEAIGLGVHRRDRRCSQGSSAGWLRSNSARRPSATPPRVAASIIMAPSAVRPLVMPA